MKILVTKVVFYIFLLIMSPSVISATQTPKSENIVDLIQNKKIEVVTQGENIANVKLKIRKLASQDLDVHIPIGTFFVSKDSGSQSMVSTSPKVQKLLNNKWVDLRIPVACANRPRKIPNSKDTFTIRKSPNQAELERLMPALNKAKAHFAVRQAAVWIVTDDANYGQLGILRSNQVRVINSNETAVAMKLLDQAEVDITLKSIWKDRWDIFNSIVDESLNAWYESLLQQVQEIRTIQKLLNSIGYKLGSADGLAGQKTNLAIARFCKEHGLGCPKILRSDPKTFRDVYDKLVTEFYNKWAKEGFIITKSLDINQLLEIRHIFRKKYPDAVEAFQIDKKNLEKKSKHVVPIFSSLSDKRFPELITAYLICRKNSDDYYLVTHNSKVKSISIELKNRLRSKFREMSAEENKILANACVVVVTPRLLEKNSEDLFSEEYLGLMMHYAHNHNVEPKRLVFLNFAKFRNLIIGPNDEHKFIEWVKGELYGTPPSGPKHSFVLSKYDGAVRFQDTDEGLSLSVKSAEGDIQKEDRLIFVINNKKILRNEVIGVKKRYQ